MTQEKPAWTQFYRKGIQDTGVVTPDNYTAVADPEPPYVLTTAALQGQNTVPVNYNPASMLYSSGNENLVLLGSSSNRCDSGCVTEVHKSDPRVRQVKPLYVPHVFKSSPGTTLPTVYNVTGMY